MTRRPDSAPPAARRRPAFDVLGWFALLSLACVVVSGTASAVFLSRFLTHHMLERDAAVSAEFVQSIVRAERSWSWFGNPAADGSRAQMESFLNHVARLPGVVRTNVYSADRAVLWSSNADLIGRRFTDNHELEEALRGEVAVESGTVPKEEHVALERDAAGRRFTEFYIPIWDEAHRNVIAAVEIYRIPDALFRAIDEGQALIWLSSGAGMILLYTALFWLAVHARRTIARQQEQLVEAEALGAVGAVASAVAHGIRNPLSSIRSSAELAAVEDEAGVRQCLADIQREADRVERWVRDLLLQARNEAVAPAAVDVSLLLAQSVQSFAGAAQRQGVEVRLHPAEVPPVQADPGPLAQALDNLIANAIEAMPDGGCLDITAALLRGGREVEVRIEDTGEGMPDSVRDGGRLFVSTKPRGTGMGLVLTRCILRRLSGTLSIRSERGSGTQVAIRLPVAAGG